MIIYGDAEKDFAIRNEERNEARPSASVEDVEEEFSGFGRSIFFLNSNAEFSILIQSRDFNEY